MIPQCPGQYGTLVVHLTDQQVPRNTGTTMRIVRAPVLLSPEQYIPGNRPLDSSQKPSIFVQMSDALSLPDTMPHQRGGKRHTAYANDALYHVKGKSCKHLPFKTDDQVLSILAQPCSFLADVDGIEVGAHCCLLWVGPAPCDYSCLSIQEATDTFRDRQRT